MEGRGLIRALIVEDEPLARDELIYLLKRSHAVEVIGECDSIELALDYITHGDVDVVFLDIQLGEQNGINLAEKIQHLKKPPEIVFATAYDEYALHAFNVQAIDYLLKPFEEERILQTIKKLEKIFTYKGKRNDDHAQIAQPSKQEKIAVTSNDRIKIITIEEILYISSQNGKTTITTEREKIAVSSTLIQLELKMENGCMLRVHRGFLVNKNKIIEIEPWFHSTYQLCMLDGEKIPVSRNYTKELKQVFGF
jgi:two-component system response regulator LytT